MCVGRVCTAWNALAASWVQADRRQECRLKLLFQKCRGMRELVSSRMCLALEVAQELRAMKSHGVSVDVSDPHLDLSTKHFVPAVQLATAKAR